MADDTTIELAPPLPGLASRASVTFMGPKHGLLRRSSPVPRAEADHAVIAVVFGDTSIEEREVDLAGVDAFLAEVAAFRSSVAQRRAANEAAHATQEELAETRPARSAALVPTCPHCGVPRQHRGRRNLVTAANPGELGRPDSGLSRAGYVALELYACLRCGSVEWFEPGALEHPLAP